MGRRVARRLELAESPTAPGEEKSEFEPKTYSSRDQVLFCFKLLLIVGVLVLALWLLDKSL